MVSYFILLEGLTTMLAYFAGVVMGIYAIYKSSKTEAKILLYFGIIILLLSHIYFATILDFLILLVTEKNMDNSYGLFSLLTYMWVGPTILLGMFIIFEVTIPEKKWFVLPIYIILSIIFEILLFLDPINSFKISYTTPDGGIIHSSLVFGTILFWLLGFIFISAFILFGVGFFVIGIQTTGILKKKFIILSYAFMAFLTLGAIDILTSPGIYVIFLRMGEASCSFVFYFGVKEEPVKEVAEEFKETEFEGPKISLVTTLSYSRPDDLSEQDLHYSREQTLCIVCRKLLKGFSSVFICPTCRTLYCEKCATELIKIDNMCWGCMGPIDESKPTTPLTKEDEDVVVDITQGEPKKKPKKDVPKSISTK